MLSRHLADQEIGRLHAILFQRVEHVRAVGRDRTVVEGDHHLVVLERQSVLVLHGADQRQRSRIDGNNAAGADGVGVARAQPANAGADMQASNDKAIHSGRIQPPDPRSIVPSARPRTGRLCNDTQ